MNYNLQEELSPSQNPSVHASEWNEQLQNSFQLLDDIRNEDFRKRLGAIEKLKQISFVIGQERTRTELLPYLADLLEDDEDALLGLCDQLGNFLDHIGGPAHVVHLLTVLEQICLVEELTVREKVRPCFDPC